MIAQLLELLKESNKVVAFTGAGISTLAGIPDFRGKNGIFNQRWQGFSVEELFDLACFRAHPEAFYSYAKDFLYRMPERTPGIVHTVLAKLEKRGIVDRIYTQNIDMLHQKAGSVKVEELHGSPRHHHCLRCGQGFDFAEIYAIVMRDEVPWCPACGGLIKPDVVFFGEEMNAPQMERAFHDFERADVALILGSSVRVYPAASLPQATHRSGGKLVVVNADPTGVDRLAACRYDNLEAVFLELDCWVAAGAGESAKETARL